MTMDHEMIRLGDVCELIAGDELDFSCVTDGPDGIPVVLPGDDDEGESYSYYTGPYDEKNLVDNGDFLIHMSDDVKIEEWVGPQALFGDHICRLVPNLERLDPHYMYYALSYIFQKLEDDENADLLINHIDVDELRDTIIPLPALDVQEQIVDVLSNAYELVELQREQMETMDMLVHSRFVQLFGDVATNSRDWPIKPLGELGERLKSRSILDKDRRPGSYPYYEASGIVDYIDEYQFDEDLLLVAKVGAVLTSGEHNIAQAAKGKTWPSDFVHIMRLNGEVTTDYVKMVINSLALEDLGLRGGVMPKLPTASLNSLPIPCPPMELQLEYAAFLKMVDEQASAMRKRLGNLAQICYSLNQLYFESSMCCE
ncbi:MAG: restriction endonuclease subunit S [bacterium]|nr:restriction endonuclease subunit S [bacterium]